MTDPPALRVQQRSTRADGKAHMVTAARELLRHSSPDDVTIREVAEASGHHHRFVQSWFGGKVGLFREVFDEIVAELAAAAPTVLNRDGIQPDTRVAARLLNWLVAADPEALSGDRPTPLLDTMSESYVAAGLEPGLARRLAVRLLATTLSMVLFQDALGVRDEEIADYVALEREMVLLLVAARSADA